MAIKDYHKRSIKLPKTAWDKLVQEVFRRDHNCCRMGEILSSQGHPRSPNCTGSRFLVPHHIILKAQLRLDILDNVLTLCHNCHSDLHCNRLPINTRFLVDHFELRHWLMVDK